MSNGGGMFSPEEVAYLKTLPAVAEATARRIIYSEAFKQSCMRRYHAGESPVKLFREAGLDPALIGYKRIERCFARWRKSSSDAMAGPQYDDRLDAASAHVRVDADRDFGPVPFAIAGASSRNHLSGCPA